MSTEAVKPIVINVYKDPPDVAEIERARQAVHEASRGELTLAEKVAFFCPIPVLDVVAALATHVVESSLPDDPIEPLRDVPEAMARDWASSDTTRAYVAKVRLQARPLIRAEVDALEAHQALITKARDCVDYAVYLGQVSSELLATAAKTHRDRMK